MNKTDELIQLASLLTPSGEIGDGMVAKFHALAKAAKLEQDERRKPKPTIDIISDPHANAPRPVQPIPVVVGRCPRCGY